MGFMRELIKECYVDGYVGNNARVNYIDLNKDITNTFKLLEDGKIPESYCKDIYEPNKIKGEKYRESLIPLTCRNIYTMRYGFPLISMNWVRELAHTVIKDGKCLEVMCGSGMWTKALRKCGVSVIATDNQSWGTKIDEYSKWRNSPFIDDIEVIDAIDAISKYGKDVDFILMSWPPYDEPIAYMVLMKMREINPNCKLIMIGEDYGGCTADDKFFDEVKITEDLANDVVQLWKINGEVKIDKNGNVIDGEPDEGLFKSFWGIHDKLFIFK